MNLDLGVLDKAKGEAILKAADEVLAGKHPAEFPLVVWQTGSGTQTNMNMNEVLANRASEILGGERGEKRQVHPNDDVNKGQSSNDVFPTAMSVAAVEAIADHVIPSLRGCATRWRRSRRPSRTSSRSAARTCRTRRPSPWARSSPATSPSSTTASPTSKAALPHLCELALGGTAVGTGLNAHPEFAVRVATELAELTGLPFVTAPNKFEVAGGPRRAWCTRTARSRRWPRP